jgi:putative phage-type endonuclease
MKILNHDQGSKEWLQWRQTRVTATDAGVILDLNPWENIQQLWERKLGLLAPKESTKAMRRGQELEPIARTLLNDKYPGNNFQPMVIEGDGDDYWMGASLDGISQYKNIICEIKCPGISTHRNVVNWQLQPNIIYSIPDYYYSQIQHQMYVANVEYCFYVSYNPDYVEKTFQTLCFPYDRLYQLNMYEKERIFYFENMVKMQSPIREIRLRK